jgi:hypothetical protein
MAEDRPAGNLRVVPTVVHARGVLSPQNANFRRTAAAVLRGSVAYAPGVIREAGRSVWPDCAATMCLRLSDSGHQILAGHLRAAHIGDRRVVVDTSRNTPRPSSA